MTTGNRPSPLPTSALVALDEGRLIDAIKAVREVESIGLADAQLRVSSYIATQPALQERLKQRTVEFRKKMFKWLVLAEVALAAAFLYWFFGH